MVKGVPMDPKISFRASARKRTISWRRRFLTFTCLPPPSYGMCLKKSHRALRGNCVRAPMDSPLTTNRATLDKNNYPHTRDLWWLYINVDLWYYHISMVIKITLIIYLLICNSIPVPRFNVSTPPGAYSFPT